MARTSITPKTALGWLHGSYVADAADLTLTVADVANYNQATASGNDLILAYNSGASAYTVTITSSADPYGRTGDITTYSLAAGEYAIFGPFRNLGWLQSDGKLYFAASNAAVKFAVIALPGTLPG